MVDDAQLRPVVLQHDVQALLHLAHAEDLVAGAHQTIAIRARFAGLPLHPFTRCPGRLDRGRQDYRSGPEASRGGRPRAPERAGASTTSRFQ